MRFQQHTSRGRGLSQESVDLSDNMNGLGCRWAFHSGGSVGYRINDHWSVMGTFDHLSNGQICTNNKGINDYGIRAAFSF